MRRARKTAHTAHCQVCIMSTWETIADEASASDLGTNGVSPAPRTSPRWRTVAAAVATVGVLILVVGRLSASRFTPSVSFTTDSSVDLFAATCVPGDDCNECATEAACVECQKTKDCADCDKGGNCDECYAAALLTCCEKGSGVGARSRQQCCDRADLKGKTSLCEKACSADYNDCGAWQCCQTEGYKCYTKHDWYAQCRPGCAPTKVEEGAEWECKVLTGDGQAVAEPLQCAADGENCRESRCCQNQDMSCYEKNQWWSSCRPTGTCVPGPWEAEAGQPWADDWSCTLDEDPKAGCQTEKVKTFTRRRAYYKPVEGCAKLGDGWTTVESKEKCRDLSSAADDTSEDMVEVMDKRYKVPGCSYDYGTKQYTWNSEPASYKKCSDSQPCVCQKCEVLAPN